MIELFGLIHRLGGEIDLQLFEGAFVCLGENHAGMCFAAGKVIKLCEGIGGVFVGGGADRERDEHLICVKTGIVVAEYFCLEAADWLQH